MALHIIETIAEVASPSCASIDESDERVDVSSAVFTPDNRVLTKGDRWDRLVLKR